MSDIEKCFHHPHPQPHPTLEQSELGHDSESLQHHRDSTTTYASSNAPLNHDLHSEDTKLEIQSEFVVGDRTRDPNNNDANDKDNKSNQSITGIQNLRSSLMTFVRDVSVRCTGSFIHGFGGGGETSSKEVEGEAAVPSGVEGGAGACVEVCVEAQGGVEAVEAGGEGGVGGGMRRLRKNPKPYLTILGSFLALFCTFGQMNAFGTFQSWYSTHQLSRFEPESVSWIGSLQLWVFFVSGGPIGYLFDLYGPRALMSAGTICYTLSIVMTSISKEYYQYLLAQGVLFGLGVGLLFYPSLSSVSTHFNKYRATALGIATAGSGLGGLIFPLILQSLFDRIGFGWAVRVSGLVCFVGCGVAVLLVSADRVGKAPSTPCTTTTGDKVQVKPSRRGCGGVLGLFSDGKFVLLCVGASFVALGCFIPFFYISDYTLSILPSSSSSLPLSPQSTSTSTSTPFLILSLMNAGSIPGRIIPSFLSDTLGHFNLLFPSALLSAILILGVWLNAGTVGGLVGFAVAYGFVEGAFIAVVTPCVVRLGIEGSEGGKGAKGRGTRVGRRIGVMYSFISVPALVGGPIAGALLTLDGGSYRGMIVFSGTTVLVGSFCVFGVKMLIDPRVFARV